MNYKKSYVGFKKVNLKAAVFGLWCCLGAATTGATQSTELKPVEYTSC